MGTSKVSEVNGDGLSVAVLDLITEAIAEAKHIEHFAEYIVENGAGNIASAVAVFIGDVTRQEGDIPSTLNLEEFGHQLQVTRELGTATLTVPIPPNGRVIFYDIPDGDIDLHRLENIGEVAGETLPRLQKTKLESQRRDFMKLHTVSMEMIQAEKQSQIFELALNAAKTMVNPDYGRIDVWDGDSFEEAVSTRIGGSEEPELPGVGSAPEYAFREGERLVIDDLDDYDHETGVSDLGESAVIAPMEDIGVFIAVNEGEDGFKPYEADLAQLLMAYAGQVFKVNKTETELRKTNETLANQKQRLEVLNRLLRHDIRNEMQVVHGMGNALTGKVEEGDSEEYLEAIISSAETVTDLTGTMRNLVDAALDNEEDSLKPVPVDEVLQKEVDNLLDSFDGVDLKRQPLVNEVYIKADDMVESVFRNILTNAVKHNDKELPQIAVEHEIEEETVTVSVADNGPGIADEKKDEIFGKGEKGENSGGTGIGMYLVNMLASRYNANVEVEDNDPEGTVFSLTFERADPSSDTQEV